MKPCRFRQSLIVQFVRLGSWFVNSKFIFINFYLQTAFTNAYKPGVLQAFYQFDVTIAPVWAYQCCQISDFHNLYFKRFILVILPKAVVLPSIADVLQYIPDVPVPALLPFRGITEKFDTSSVITGHPASHTRFGEFVNPLCAVLALEYCLGQK